VLPGISRGVSDWEKSPKNVFKGGGVKRKKLEALKGVKPVSRKNAKSPVY